MFPIIGEVVIRTNGGILNVNAKNDTVRHFGNAEIVAIDDIATASYHENGKVALAKIAKGRIVVEDDAELGGIHLVATGNTFGTEQKRITITLEEGKELPDLSRDNVENLTDEGITLCEIQTNPDTEEKDTVQIKNDSIIILDSTNTPKSIDNNATATKITETLTEFKTSEQAHADIAYKIAQEKAEEKETSTTWPIHDNIYSNVNVKTAFELFENEQITLIELMDYLDGSNINKTTTVSEKVAEKLNIESENSYAGQYTITNTATGYAGYLYSGTITLTQNIEIKTNVGWSTALGFVIDGGKTLTIDLNGYTLSQTGNCTGSTGYALFKVRDGGTLNVIDSSEEKTGKISGNLCAIQAYNGATVNIFNGTIDCGVSVSKYNYLTNCDWYENGVDFGKVSIYLQGKDSTLNIYGGSIVSTNIIVCGYDSTQRIILNGIDYTASSYKDQSKELEGFAIMYGSGSIINNYGGTITGRNTTPSK